MIFDLLVSAAIGLGIIKDSVKEKQTNDYFRARARAAGEPTYCDIKGNTYSTETDERVLMDYVDGHHIIKTLNGRMLRDLTQEKYERCEEDAKKEAIAKGKRFYKAMTIRGDYYKEVSTGKVYKRTIGNLGDRFHNPDIYYVEVVIKNGKEDYTAKKVFRSVYEFGEGPTDEEKTTERELYDGYYGARERYFTFDGDMKNALVYTKKWELYREYHDAEMEYVEYKRAINKKYFEREGK